MHFVVTLFLIQFTLFQRSPGVLIGIQNSHEPIPKPMGLTSGKDPWAQPGLIDDVWSWVQTIKPKPFKHVTILYLRILIQFGSLPFFPGGLNPCVFSQHDTQPLVQDSGRPANASVAPSKPCHKATRDTASWVINQNRSVQKW